MRNVFVKVFNLVVLGSVVFHIFVDIFYKSVPKVLHVEYITTPLNKKYLINYKHGVN